MTEALRVTPAPRCYLCGADGDTLFERVSDRLFAAPGRWTLRSCPDCGLIWLDPVPEARELSRLQAEYYTHDEATPAGDPPFSDGSPLRRALRVVVLGRLGYRPPTANPPDARTEARARWLARVPAIREIIEGEVAFLPASPGGRLLDVGCGNGDFLLRMRALGWRTLGVEPDPAAAALARRRLGDGVREGSVEQAGVEDDSVDAITLNHVIEHLADPLATLAACRRLLKPEGRLVVVTPNARSLGRRWFGQAWLHWDPPRHLVLFDPATLRECLHRAGLEPQRLRSLTRGARWSWTASRAIARGDAAGELRPGPATQNGAGAIGFALLEQAFSWAASWGEELHAVASRR